MKSLQESLFDQDLIEKGVPIDFDILRDMLFDFGVKNVKFAEKSDVFYHAGRQSIYFKRIIDDKVCVDLGFGVTNLCPNDVGFNIPRLFVYDRFGGYGAVWRSSDSDITIASRRIFEKNPAIYRSQSVYKSTIDATNDNIKQVFDLYKGMLIQYCSKEFEKQLRKYVSRYERKHEIPGFIMDLLMKNLIEKA